jgi:hypothetical protein
MPTFDAPAAHHEIARFRLGLKAKYDAQMAFTEWFRFRVKRRHFDSESKIHRREDLPDRH